MAKKTLHTVDELVEFLKKENKNETIEGNLLRSKAIRELYKLIGKPEEKDFPDEYRIAGRCWNKHTGYTKYIEFSNKGSMLARNREETNWHISRASGAKVRIVEEYTRAGWHCRVLAYNVMCTKYVKHPKYENIWVCFYSSRDCNKYAYVIEEE